MHAEQINNIINEVKKAVIGKDSSIFAVLKALLAGGHVLIEDIPGVGKTTMALAFAKACGLTQNRIQFTPDVLPSDIIGFSMYQKETGKFVYQPGAVLCNLFLADEINRTSSKTQSALLEVMEEGTVTVDGVSREVPKPFFVMATQNPVGSAGTQLLPDSQLDRFMVCISMGYPDTSHEIEILKGRSINAPVLDIQKVVEKEDILLMQNEVSEIFIHDAIYQYIVALITRTRSHPLLELGVSPRGSIILAKMTKASAYLSGRNYAIPEDVISVIKEVVLHRVILNAKGKVNRATKDGILQEILESVPKPTPKGNVN